jgi:hypothetical protein
MTIDFPLEIIVHDASDPSSASDSSYTDALLYTDCARALQPEGQAPRFVQDNDS